MKLFLLLVIICSFNEVFAQNFFVNNRGTSTWVSKYEEEPSKIFDAASFGLSKLLYSTDSIDRNVSIWNFSNSTLTISNYEFQSKTETRLLTYSYTVIPDKAVLVIMIPESLPLLFSQGMVSTGNYATLTRLKNKKSKL